jgi:hypothetical protein
MSPKDILSLIWAFMLLSVGGFMLHLRIHPPAASLFNWIPAVFGAVNVFVLPLLFRRPATAPLAFLLCCITVIAGTVGMAYFSIVEWKEPVTLYTVVFKSTLADILILGTKVPLGYVVMKYVCAAGTAPAEGKCIDE